LLFIFHIFKADSTATLGQVHKMQVNSAVDEAKNYRKHNGIKHFHCSGKCGYCSLIYFIL